MTARTLTRQAEALGKTIRECPVCESGHLEYEFVVDRAPVCSCQDCGLLFLNPQPGARPSQDKTIASISANLNVLFAANAAERIQQLVEYCTLRSGVLLVIGDDAHLIEEGKKAGFDVIAVTVHEFESAAMADLTHRVDACILFRALEKMYDPLAALRAIRRALKEDGALMVVSPTTNSRAARLLRTSWWEFNRSNLFYFSTDTLHSLLIKAGFGNPLIVPDHSSVSLNYLRRQLGRNPRIPKRYRILGGLMHLIPLLRNKFFRIAHGRTAFFVRPKPVSRRPSLSVIVPVYNEATTVTELLDRVLGKSIDGLDIEVILVESNSCDGTRDLVCRYADHPSIRLILEDRPRGKGFAVRNGITAARGDIILIQDGDLEYDVNDYDALVAPILHYRTSFVLGSRHTASNSAWKIREFTNSPLLSGYFNLGHALLLGMFNLVYRQNLSDPFTMFKVFRRECIFGLRFECDRFDFDNEIVIKLLRKGHKPLEVPVNYVSRSIHEGKKVTLFLDPLRWICALFRFRSSPLYDVPFRRR